MTNYGFKESPKINTYIPNTKDSSVVKKEEVYKGSPAKNMENLNNKVLDSSVTNQETYKGSPAKNMEKLNREEFSSSLKTENKKLPEDIKKSNQFNFSIKKEEVYKGSPAKNMENLNNKVNEGKEIKDDKAQLLEKTSKFKNENPMKDVDVVDFPSKKEEVYKGSPAKNMENLNNKVLYSSVINKD